MKLEFTSQFPCITHDQMTKVLRACLQARLTPMIWGERGIGKTQHIEAFASEEGYEVIYLLLSGEDNLSFGGIPTVVNGIVQFTNLLRALCEDKVRQGKRAIVFLDDFPAGAVNCGSSLFSFLQSHQVGNYFLPENWGVVCAGNPPNVKDSAYGLPRPSMSRLMHYLLEPPTVDEWAVWAVQHGVLPEITAFLKSYPQMLRFEGIGTHEVTPRSWENASRAASLVPPDERWLFVGGATTRQIGEQFRVFQTSSTLDIDNILQTQTIPQLDSIGKQHHLITSLATLFPSRHPQISSLLLKMLKGGHGELFVAAVVLIINAHAKVAAEVAIKNNDWEKVTAAYRKIRGGEA